MKFSTTTTELAAALATATRAISARSTLPILDGVFIEAEEQGVKVTCSDGRMTISAFVDAEVEIEGAVVAPGKLFSEFVKRSSGTISISVTAASNRIRITAGRSRVNLAGSSSEEFPVPNTDDCTRRLLVTHAQLREMLQKTLPMVSPGDLREVLTGCFIGAHDGALTLVGMDGFRLARAKGVAEAAESAIAAIVPGRSAAEIQRLLKGDENEICELRFGDNGLCAMISGVEVYTRLVAGEYVDYERVIPKSFATRVRVATDALLDSVKRASIVANAGNRLVRLRTDGDVLCVDADSEIAEIRDEMPAQTYGDDVSIAFNVKYILDALATIDWPDVEFSLNSSTQPCIITRPDQADQDEHIVLVLPVRTSTAQSN